MERTCGDFHDEELQEAAKAALKRGDLGELRSIFASADQNFDEAVEYLIVEVL